MLLDWMYFSHSNFPIDKTRTTWIIGIKTERPIDARQHSVFNSREDSLHLRGTDSRSKRVDQREFSHTFSAVKETKMVKRMLSRTFFPGVLLLWLLLGVVRPALCEDPKKILSIEAYDMLNTVPNTFLIDVRTQAEYQFVGHPFKAYLYPYQFLTNHFSQGGDKPGYSLSQKNKNFLDQINKAFKKNDNLLIMCRDGTRSALATRDLVNDGFKNVFDVMDGFEGPEFPAFENESRHKFYRQLARRNRIYGYEHRRHYGWQYWGLPWTYEMDPKFIYPPDLNPSEK